MAEFNQGSYMPMDRAYMTSAEISPKANIEAPLFPIDKVGQTVTEGARFGTLINTVQGAIRMGSGSIELQTGLGGGAEAVGAEAYGKEAREALRELARANEVTLTSVHSPTQVGNLSGLSQQGFSEEQRKFGLDEVKKAIKFAAETTQGGAIVVHTGEYQRSIFDANWNKEGKWKGAFIAYDEEPERATVPLVDTRTGKLVTEIRRNQLIHRPVWNLSDKDYSYEADELDIRRGMAERTGQKIHVSKESAIDYEGKLLNYEDKVPLWNPEKNEFEIKAYTWEDFEDEAEKLNRIKGLKKGDPNYIKPEEAAFREQISSQIAIAKGWKMNYGSNINKEMEALKDLKKQLEFYEKIEKEIPEDERWKLQKEAHSFAARMIGHADLAPPPKHKMPSEIIRDGLNELRQTIEQHREMVIGQEQQIKENTETMKNVVSVGKYAEQNSIKSYVEAGIHAMNETRNNPYAERDIFIAPENIFPEMGYGSHPQELKELVQNARKAMAERLSTSYMENPTGRRIRTEEEAKDINRQWKTKLKAGDTEIIANPNFMGISEEKAKNIAKRHIKATLDTQHLGMWWKHFKPEAGETEQDRRERFNDWYMDQVKDLQNNEIIGNIHLVDSIGGGHHHLPMGQGELPLHNALAYLKKKGYTGSINSEAHGEAQMGADRILVETWKQLGSPIYSMGSHGADLAGPSSWGDVHRSYFGKQYPPNFIFGAYAPSQDFTLWSDVPME